MRVDMGGRAEENPGGQEARGAEAAVFEGAGDLPQ